MEIDKINKFLEKHIKICIKNNKDTHIHDNKIEIVIPTESKNIGCFERNFLSYKDTRELLEETRVIESIYEREKLLVEKLEMIRALYERKQETLIIRFWGMYSGISTIRSFYDKSEMASLEWDEKRILIDLAKKHFPIKMILTLNVEKVLSFGFTVDDIWQRIEDMCIVCRDLNKYDNFQFVIDEDKDIDSTIIIDGLLMMRQYDFVNESFNYKKSYWTSDFSEIKGLCYEFEERFNKLENNYFLMKKIMAFDTYEEYVRMVMKNRIDKYLERR